jgi:type I restriction enzyme S subunit
MPEPRTDRKKKNKTHGTSKTYESPKSDQSHAPPEPHPHSNGAARGSAGDDSGAVVKNGWKTEPLGDLCEFHRGLTYSKRYEVALSDNVVLRATNIDLATNQLDFTELKFISDEVVVPDSKKVRKNSLIICTASGSKSHLGKVAYIDDDYDYAFGGFMGMITPKNGLVSKYLFHLMTSPLYQDFIGALSDGVNINNLKFDDLKQLRVPHPSPSEQRRIVAILDEAFAGIATAKQNAEQNLQNARALFESHLNAVFSQCGEGWVERRLGAVLDIGSSKRIRETDWTPSGVPFYGGKEIVRLAKFGSVVSNAYISEEKYDEYASKYDMPREGDVLITARGTIGVGYVVKKGDKFYYKDGNIISLREKVPTNPNFILYAFRSKPVIAQFADLTGATVTHLPIERANNLIVHMPDFKTQNSVTAQLGDLENETDRLESLYQRKLDALDELKKSLLHQAFSGRL